MTYVACGAMHTLCIARGAVFACGRNRYGQLGLGHTDDCVRLMKDVGALSSYTVRAVAAGDDHSLFLTDSGVVFACGSNRWAQVPEG